MKKIYPLFFPLGFILMSGCSKDIFKSYENRIIGTWRITDVNKNGFGGNTSTLPFTNGTLSFGQNGSLTYVSSTNVNYKGRWEIVRTVTDDETTHSLQLTAIDFTTQQILTEYYNNMNFQGANHFKANITLPFHTYVTHFRR